MENNKKIGWKGNLNYLRYLSSRIFLHALFFQISVGLYLLCLVIYLIVIPRQEKASPDQMWRDYTSFGSLSPFIIFAGMIVASVCVKIFKECQDDGMRIALCLKPLSRLSFMLINFLFIYLVCALLIILSSVVVLLAFQLNSKADYSKLPPLIEGLSLGIAVTCLCMSSISTLICLIPKISSVLILTITTSLSIILVSCNTVAIKFNKGYTEVFNDMNMNLCNYAYHKRNQYDLNSNNKEQFTGVLITNTLQSKRYDFPNLWEEVSGKVSRYSTFYDSCSQLMNFYLGYSEEDREARNIHELYDILPKTILKNNFDQRPIAIYQYHNDKRNPAKQIKVKFLGNNLTTSISDEYWSWSRQAREWNFDPHGVSFLSSQLESLYLDAGSYQKGKDKTILQQFDRRSFCLPSLIFDPNNNELDKKFLDEQAKENGLGCDFDKFIEAGGDSFSICHSIERSDVIKNCRRSKNEQQTLRFLYTAKCHLWACYEFQKFQESRWNISADNAYNSLELSKAREKALAEKKWDLAYDKIAEDLVTKSCEIHRASSNDDRSIYERLNFSQAISCESYGNMVNYIIKGKNNYFIWSIAWIVISLSLLAISVVVFYKTDVK